MMDPIAEFEFFIYGIPADPLLASTFPHHKHVHPDIKHHRVPAPGIGFTLTNLPFLIEEIINQLILS